MKAVFLSMQQNDKRIIILHSNEEKNKIDDNVTSQETNRV